MFLLDRRIAGCTEATIEAYNSQLMRSFGWRMSAISRSENLAKNMFESFYYLVSRYRRQRCTPRL